jgi:hypothetical protein
MLQKFTEEIAECYAPASECRERAKQALDPATKQDFLEMKGAGLCWHGAMKFRSGFRISRG